MPLQRRLPKRGFKNPFRKEYVALNVSIFADRESDEFKIEDYRKMGIVKNLQDGVKILGDGEVSRAITVHAHKFSKQAREKIEKAGGTCVVVNS